MRPLFQKTSSLPAKRLLASRLLRCCTFMLALTTAQLLRAEAEDETLDLQQSANKVQLSADKQALAGIKTQPLRVSDFRSEMQASARVLDIQPLLSQREQFFAARTEQQSAAAALALVEQAIQRAKDLYDNGISSKRQLQEQEMAHTAAKSRLMASNYRLQSIQDALKAQWGDVLASWISTSQQSTITSFINGQQALLLLSLPAGQSLPAGLHELVIDPNGERLHPQTAYVIASAPQGSELSQGETYFLRTAKAKLRSGMRLSAWFANSVNSIRGISIPTSALIWHAGMANIYLKTAPTAFQRFALSDYHPQTQGYFIADALPEQAEVVVSGAQILLSQEFRAVIPEEDDGD